MAGNSWPGPLADLLDESIDDDQVERLRSGVEARRRVGPHRRRWSHVLVAALVAGFAFILIIVAALLLPPTLDGPTSGEPIRLLEGGALTTLAVDEAAHAPRQIRLDDGSTIDLAPGTVLGLVTNDGHLVVLRLERGRATFEVDSSTGRTWAIDAGLATVEVVGTVFTVSRTAEEVSVSVARGRVRVVGDVVEGGEHFLAMGDSVELRESSPPSEELVVLSPEALTQHAEESRPADEDTTDLPVQPQQDWRRSVRQGDWSDAYDALGTDGLRREARQADTVAELLLLADVARRSGHPSEAVAPLERAIEDYPADRRAAVAAFTLGLLESERLNRPQRAIRAFRRCVDLGPPGALREDAWGRLAEAHGRAGQYGAARQAAREYLRRFPEGSRAERFRRWIEAQ